MTTAAEAGGSDDLRGVLGHDRVMAILRYRKAGNVIAAVEALISGGVRVLEVTVDTPGCWPAIAEAKRVPGVFIGLGTVTDSEQVARAADAGCGFIVSPGFDLDVVSAALARGLQVFPGVATGTEMLAARRAGCEFFKLFPAGALGTRYVRELRGPFSEEALVATGGISIPDIPSWLDAGAFAVAVGSDLAGREPPARPSEADELTKRAYTALALARRTDGGE